MLVLLDPARRPVVGHRGNRAHAPENTLESFAQAIRLGVDALECDVHLSRDGVPVVIHDPTLERTTDATGAVRDRSAAELQRVDAGARFTTDDGRTFPYRGTGIAVPTLEEVLVSTGRIPLIIEIKTVEAAAALAVIERTGCAGRVLIGSFLDDALTPFARAGIPVGASSRAIVRLYVPALLGTRPPALPYQAMCIPRSHRGIPLPVRQFARVMRGAGGPVHVWTVNSAARARQLWRAGVSGIISDDPAVILAERGSAA
jgi:glycerophosphoryl diester phosphodiesterase